MCKLEKAKNGSFTLKYNGRYIHSKYNPQKEAEQFIKNNEDLLKKDKVLVYGIGLGYHIEKILNNSNALIYIFEWNDKLIENCEKVNGDIFKNKNIKLIKRNNQSFYKLFSKILLETSDLLIHKPSLETIKDENKELYNLLNDFLIKKQLIKITENSEDKYKENYEFNIKMDHFDISDFIENIKGKDKPIVITSAGPSLEDELKLLQGNRQKFNVFTVGSALRTVVENGIIPDAVFLIDGAEEIRNQLKDFESLNIPLCFSAYASKEALEIYKGPKYMFNKENGSQIFTGGTVAGAALSIATKCKPDKIIFLGQDLAIIDGKNHTDSYEKMHIDKNKSEYKLIEAIGVNGEKINTIQSYILFRNNIEKIIRTNQAIKYINCSRGLHIEGTENSSLKNILINM